jgi:predicted thioesterase
LIGSGFHERTVIDTARFMAKVQNKARVITAKAA